MNHHIYGCCGGFADRQQQPPQKDFPPMILSEKTNLNTATRNEILFIQNLGTGKWSIPGKKVGRIGCVRGYLQGSLTRTRWGDIDKKAAMTAATDLLIELS
jgi:hypothetical protein